MERIAKCVNCYFSAIEDFQEVGRPGEVTAFRVCRFDAPNLPVPSRQLLMMGQNPNMMHLNAMMVRDTYRAMFPIVTDEHFCGKHRFD